MAHKGGPIREPISPVSQSALNDTFESAKAKWGADAYNQGSYNSIGTTQAASCEAMVGCTWWLEQLL